LAVLDKILFCPKIHQRGLADPEIDEIPKIHREQISWEDPDPIPTPYVVGT
jgi:hypothetical protein